MKLFLNLLILLFLFCIPVKAEKIITNFTAKIFKSNTINAKKKALDNVLYNALKKTLENLLDDKTIDQNYEVIKNEIYKFKSNYIIDYDVINEKNLDNKLYKITVSADVDKTKIRKKLEDLRIIEKRFKKKSVLVIYFNRSNYGVPLENNAVKISLEAIQQAFKEQNFRTFNKQILREINLSLKNDDLVKFPSEKMVALALNYNADILVIMQMDYEQLNKQNDPFYTITADVNFSVFDTYTGQQISENTISASEFSMKKPKVDMRDILVGTAGRHASIENVRITANNIQRYYQKLGEMGQGFTVIFSGFSPESENIIIDYIEKNSDFNQLAELKNTLGYLELELFSLKRKSVLRRRITIDLLEKEIDTVTRSIAGNKLFFINPNPMYEQ